MPIATNAEEHECCGRDSNQTKKPGRSSRKRGYPMIEPKEKKWPPMDVGGHFLVREECRDTRPRVSGLTGRAGSPPGRRVPTGWKRETKKRPEKSDPTPLSYHTLPFKSTGKWLPEGKICALHKNKRLHLGNIPSWKVRKSMISYRHKEEIQKQ